MRRRTLLAVLTVFALLFSLSACRATAGAPSGFVSEMPSAGPSGAPSPGATAPVAATPEPTPEPTRYYIADPQDATRYIQTDPAELGEGSRCWIVDPENGSLYIEVVLTEPNESGEYDYVPYTGPNLTQEKLDAVLAQVMEDYSATAVSVAVIEDGEVTVSGAWGWAVKNEREMTVDTKVRVASIAKVAIGMCAMAMAEDGLLELDAPLSDYWGESVRNPYSKGQPSAYTLMTHTSSIMDREIQGGLSNLRNLLNRSWRNMEPGNGGYWYYSNFGFCVLGTTLELASDGLLDDYFQTRYLEPMGIRATLHSGKLEANELASLYNPWAEELPASRQAGYSVPSSIGQGASYFPGGLNISTPDLARLVSILINDGMYNGVQYLSPESVADMETPRFAIDYLEGTYPFEQCLVLRHQEDLMGRSSIYYHTGSAYGVYALISYDPEARDGVVVVTVGAPRRVNDRGLYTLCADLSERLYAEMEGELSSNSEPL